MRHALFAARGVRRALIATALLASTSSLAAQVPSSRQPQLFAEGIVSTSDDEFGGSLTPNGDTIYFSKSAPHSYRYSMLKSHQVKGGAWSRPTMLPFSGRYTDSDPTLSPDGTKNVLDIGPPRERTDQARLRPVDGRAHPVGIVGGAATSS